MKCTLLVYKPEIMFWAKAEEKLFAANVFCTIKRRSSMKNNAGNNHSVAIYIKEIMVVKKRTRKKWFPNGFLQICSLFEKMDKKKLNRWKKVCRLSSIFPVFSSYKTKGSYFYKRWLLTFLFSFRLKKNMYALWRQRMESFAHYIYFFFW